MDSKRIGTQAQGEIPAVWPELNMDGRPYERPADTLNIPGGKFVVLPRPHRASDIERLQAMLAADEKARGK